jgi:O-antigen ligase
MGMFVAALGMGMIAVIGIIKASGARRILAWAVIIATLLAGAVIMNTGGVLFDRMATISRDTSIRFELYSQTKDLIARRPVVGFGGGTYEDAFKAVKADPLRTDATFDAAHDLYLELAVELGIPAAVAVVMSVIILAGATAKIALRRRQNWMMPAAAAVTIFVGGIHSLVDFSLQIPSIVLLSLFVLAIGFAQAYLSHESP